MHRVRRRRSRERLNNRTAEALASGFAWDVEIPGFFLRVLPSGRKAWGLKYWSRDQRQGWLTIGTFPALSADEARRLARQARATVEKGGDPSQERRASRTAAADAEKRQVWRLAEHYLADLPKRASLRGGGLVSPRYVSNETRQLRLALAETGSNTKSVDELGADDLARLLRRHAARPATARARFGAVSRFLEWCRDNRLIAANPAEAIGRRQRPKPPPPRRRVVPLADLAALWHAAPVLTPTYADLARVLIVLPVRRGEAARMAWQDLDLTKGEWKLPGAITKNGDPHRLALPPLALDILKRRHKAARRPASGLVFPPRRGAVVDAWSRMRLQLAEASGITTWTWHDFRRSFASLMAERGVAEPVADAVLNHRQAATRGGVLAAYQHARRWPEQKNAMLAWGQALAEAISAAAKTTRAAP